MTGRSSIAVVGGSYVERCADPSIDQLWGSGLRAARILNVLGSKTELFTAIDDRIRERFDAVAHLHEINTRPVVRDKTVEFHYETPLHPASFDRAASAPPLTVEADAVLAFGMIETSWEVSAERAVIDPQHGSVVGLRSAVQAAEIAVVLNEHEARKVAGTEDLHEAMSRLHDAGIDVVVVKRGARGGLYSRGDAPTPFGVVPTTRVEPIGSGDAFSAGFANAWAVQGADVRSACEQASRTAAAHSLAGAGGFTRGLLEQIGTPQVFAESLAAQVYLAAPFFNVAERSMVRLIRDAVTQIGVDIFSPLHEVGAGGDEVAVLDLEGLQHSTAVLALLPGADAGTLYEVGWASHAGIPIVGYDEHPNSHQWTMLRGTGAVLTSDVSSAVYQASWQALSHAAAQL